VPSLHSSEGWTVLSLVGHRKEEQLDVAAEPPRIVLEGRESCSNAERVRARLDDTLAQARAPGPGWSVTMRVERDPGNHALRAAADVANDGGVRIAHRDLAGTSSDCEAFAEAVGVWASLVLDRERRRTAPSAPPPAPKSANDDVASHPTVPPSAQRTEAAGGEAGSVNLPGAADAPLDDPGDGPLGKDSKRMRDVAEAASPARAPNTLEVGIGTFLMSSISTNSIMGGSPYAVIEASPGFFLRPALAFGQELDVHGDSISVTLFAARIDACARIPGNYMPNRGLEVDLCGGTDVAFTYLHAGQGPAETTHSAWLPFVSVGPSFDLGGEIGGGWWVVIRAVGGVNVVHERVIEKGGNSNSVADPGWLSGRLELAVAWRFR
jgi:hypothetical protein